MSAIDFLDNRSFRKTIAETREMLGNIYDEPLQYYIDSDLEILELNKYAINIFDMPKVAQKKKALDILHDQIDKYFKPNAKMYKAIQKSQVLGEILSCQNHLDKYDITPSQAMQAICSFFNIVRSNGYVRLADRYIAKHLSIGKEKVNQIFFALCKTNLLDLKIENGFIQIKLNKELLVEDEYFRYRCVRGFKKDKQLAAQQGSEGMYFYENNYRTFFRNLRETVMGITIAYNELRGHKFDSTRRQSDLVKYGERTDIKYLEIPVHIICNTTRLPLGYIESYVQKLLKGAKYISKRDKVYQSNIYDSTYYWEDYKSASLVDYKEAKEDLDRLEVTEHSAILFVEEFKNTHTGKNVLKKLDNYKQIVLAAFQNILETNCLIAEDQIRINNIVKESIENNFNTYKGNWITDNENNKSQFIFDNGNSLIPVSKMCKVKRGINWMHKKVNVNFNKLNIEKAVKLIKYLLKQLEDINICSRHSKYNTNTITKLVNYIKEQIDNCKELYNKYFNYLCDNGLGSILG